MEVLRNLNATTQRVYRFLYKQGGKPVGVHEVQNGLALSSPSVAHYHIRKLVEQGLAKEVAGGYVVDKVVFENMIRIRRSVIPFQTTYLALFVSTFVIMLTVFRPAAVSSVYIFAILVNAIAIGAFLYETVKSLRQKL
jgi:alkyl hydroperoxide reductase subunit AhpF